jgi:hypothetical protein
VRAGGCGTFYLVIFYKRIIPAHDRRVRTMTTNLAFAPYRMSGMSVAH